MLAAHTMGASNAAGSLMNRLYIKFASVPATTAWRKDNQFTAPEGATADDWEPSEPAITRAHREEACGGRIGWGGVGKECQERLFSR